MSQIVAGAAAAAVLPAWAADAPSSPPFKISLAQWSLHRTIRSGQLDHLDFAKTTREEFGIEAVEYVNQFFADKAQDTKYLEAMRKRAADQGVRSLLIMIDREGQLGDADEAKRREAVDNHKKWVEAAKFLGCHSIRVNAASSGSFAEQQQRAADGLRRLSDFAAELDINVLVENHGGLSSHGQWLAGTIELVDRKNCGTLPDFGNFRIREGEQYDPYQGVEELMPYAKAVSAKSFDFDEQGNETTLDYPRLMEIVLAQGYDGYVGIEYEGRRLGEIDGIRATQKLLQRIQQERA